MFIWEQGWKAQIDMAHGLRPLISTRNSLSSRIARKSLKTLIGTLFYPKLRLGANLLSTASSHRIVTLLAPASTQGKMTCAAS